MVRAHRAISRNIYKLYSALYLRAYYRYLKRTLKCLLWFSTKDRFNWNAMVAKTNISTNGISLGYLFPKGIESVLYGLYGWSLLRCAAEEKSIRIYHRWNKVNITAIRWKECWHTNEKVFGFHLKTIRPPSNFRNICKEHQICDENFVFMLVERKPANTFER